MAIAVFAGGPPGEKGDRGIPNDRDLNSMIMLTWLGSEPVVKGYDLYANNFSTADGLDPESIASYNSLGYYEPTIANTSNTTTVSFTDASDIYRYDYKDSIYRWVQDNNEYGHFEGLTYILTSGGAAVNKGGGKVGLPCIDQPYTTGQFIEVRGSTYYSTTFTVDAASSVNEIVVTSAYSAETFGNTTTVNQRITLGAGNNNPDIQSGLVVDFYSDTRTIMSITGSGYRYSETKLDSIKSTYPVKGIFDASLVNNQVVPGSYITSTTSGWNRVTNDQPTIRYSACAAYDNISKNVWMFGGYGPQYGYAVNELWKYSTVSGQWTRISPVGSSPSARTSSSLIFDPVNNQLILFGGYISTYTNEMWKYNVVSGSWSQQTFTGGPTARRYHTAVYMTNSGTMLVYGGNTGSRSSDLWEYMISTNTWRQMSLSNAPTRDMHASIYQSASGCMITHGGYNATATEQSETWKLDYTSSPNKWVQLTSSTSTFRQHGAFYDAAGDSLYVIAGVRGNTAKALEIYKYDFKSTWQAITPSTSFTTIDYNSYDFPFATDTDNNVFYVFGGYGGNYRSSLWVYSPLTNIHRDVLPDTRYDCVAVFVKSRNAVYMGFGSNTSNHLMNDLWKVDCSNSTWSRIYTAASPASTARRRGSVMVYSPFLDAILLFSGEGNNTNDIWKYDFALNNWVQLFPTGVLPPYRYYAGSAYDEDHERLYIFGGLGATGYSDLWYYDVKSNSWVKVAPLGSSPTATARRLPGMVYDSINKCLWLFGGYDGSATYYNTLHKYIIESNTWVQMQYTGTSVSVRYGLSMGFDPKTKSVLIFGGYCNSPAAYLNDLYRYDTTSNIMYAVSPDLFVPQAKTQTACAFNNVTGDFYIFGGYYGSVPNHIGEFHRYNIWDGVTPSGIIAITTSGSQLNTKHWGSVTNITPSTTIPGDSNIYHTLSYDQCNSFVIASGTSWLPISRNNSGTWQYLDVTGTWQNSPVNDRNTSLKYALTVSGNRMTGSTLSSITASGYALAGGFSAGNKTLDFGVGFNSAYNCVPQLYSYSVSYAVPSSDLTIITKQWLASVNNPVSSLCLLDIKPLDSIILDVDINVWISMDDGVTYDQISGLTILRNDSDGHQIIKGINTVLTARDDKRMRLKVITHNSKRIEVHAIGAALRY
jgi:hypothetical protein